MKSSDTAESILSLYNYKLPFVVAEYVCRIYRSNIVCNTKISYKTLFANFIEYKDHISYLFNVTVEGNKEGYNFTKLTGVEVNIPVGKDSEFMEKYSNMIFTSSADCGLEWFDEEDGVDDVKIDKNKYAGRVKLIF
jgi:hypothetical protein